MPYDVIKRGDKFVVQKQDGSKTFGTHDTREDANKQLAALNIAEQRHAESRSLHLLGALGQVRTEMDGKTEYLVVPVVALMEGVIHAVNAETPEFVPFSTLEKCAESWNGKPITIGHPKGADGKQCSAQDDGIIRSVGIGKIRNSRVDVASKKMLMEALIETSKAKKLHPDMYQQLAEGGTEEVSVGAMVVTDHKSGKHGVKPYVGSWTFAEGDHLAFLPGGRGACSVAMGCGTHRTAMRACEDSFELEAELRALWEDKGGNDTHGRESGGASPKEKSAAANKASKSARTEDQHKAAAALHREAATAHGKGSLGAAAHEHFAQQHDKRAESAKLRGLEVNSIIDPETLRCLRDIPQSARDEMSAADFAGPDQSFPIKTQADVDAASHLVGKAKDPAAVKAKVISIAKKKGLKLPDAWMKAAAEADETPDEEAAEEAAELVMYQTMRSLWDSCDKSWDQISTLIDALIAADETESPTETPEEEDAEETLETSRLESIRSLCSAMMGCCQGILSATYSQSLAEDSPTMRSYAGARHNMADTKAIQAVHDHSMSLGAVCDRSNYKQLEGKLEDAPAKLDASKLNDPVRFYIESVRQRAAGAR